MLQGMATSNFQAADLSAARTWYTGVFGIEPYFVRDGYLEWRLGRDQDEVGIIDARFVPGAQGRTPGGQVVYWSVTAAEGVPAEVLARGAAPYEAITQRGPETVAG